MPVTLKIIKSHEFVKLTATGTLDHVGSLKAVLDIVSLMEMCGDCGVMVDTRGGQVHLSVTELYQLGVELASHPSLRSSKIALLAPVTRADWARFLETVASNRGIAMEVFTDFEAAMTWLVMEDSSR
jgi:hypothetical protein